MSTTRLATTLRAADLRQLMSARVRPGVARRRRRFLGEAEFERGGEVYPVIPLLRDGAEIAAGFLFLNTWIDFRDALLTEEGRSELVVSLADVITTEI